MYSMSRAIAIAKYFKHLHFQSIYLCIRAHQSSKFDYLKFTHISRHRLNFSCILRSLSGTLLLCKGGGGIRQPLQNKAFCDKELYKYLWVGTKSGFIFVWLKTTSSPFYLYFYLITGYPSLWKKTTTLSSPEIRVLYEAVLPCYCPWRTLLTPFTAPVITKPHCSPQKEAEDEPLLQSSQRSLILTGYLAGKVQKSRAHPASWQ